MLTDETHMESALWPRSEACPNACPRAIIRLRTGRFYSHCCAVVGTARQPSFMRVGAVSDFEAAKPPLGSTRLLRLRLDLDIAESATFASSGEAFF